MKKQKNEFYGLKVTKKQREEQRKRNKEMNKKLDEKLGLVFSPMKGRIWMKMDVADV